MINPGTLNTQERGTYKGYRIERQWMERNGKVIDYTKLYIAYDSNNNIVNTNSKLSSLKQYLDGCMFN